MKAMSSFMTSTLAFTHKFRESSSNQTHIIWLCLNQQVNPANR